MKYKVKNMVRRAKMQKLEGNKDKEHCNSYFLGGVCLAVVLLFSGACVVSATTYYVNNTWPGANNSNSGMMDTNDSAWLTIDYALSTVSAGDTVYVRGGPYNETATLDASGNTTHRITIKSDTNAVLNANYGRADGLIANGDDYFTFDGFTVQNYTHSGIYVASGADEPNITISNCTVENIAQNGIYVRAIGYARYKNLIVHNNTATNCTAGNGLYSGIAINYADNSTISNNTVYDISNGGNGINWAGNYTVVKYNNLINIGGKAITTVDAQHSIVRDNTIDTAARAIRFDYFCRYNKILNNTISNTVTDGIQLYPATEGTAVQYNVLHNSSIEARSNDTFIYGNRLDNGSWITIPPSGGMGVAVYSENVTIERNTLTNCKYLAIASHINTTVTNNIFDTMTYANGALHFGLSHVYGPSYNTTITNNVFYNISHDAIDISENSGETTCTIKNNIFMYVSGFCVDKNTGESVVVSYNNIWACNPPYFDGVTATNTREEDPSFVDPPLDFHLKSKYGRRSDTGFVYDETTSPCIDAGDPNDNCFNEQPPNGGRINLGAYGNTEAASMSFDVTTFSPVTNTTITPSPNESGWNTVTPVVVTFFRSGSGSDISYTNYSKTSEAGPWTTVNTYIVTGLDAENATDITESGFNVTVLDEGNTTIWYYSADTNTNIEITKGVTVKIDTSFTEPGSDFIGEWHFDEDTGETVVDSSGNANTGTIYGNAMWTAGKLGSALSFDGAEDYIEILAAPSLNSITSQITIEAWVKSDFAQRGTLVDNWYYDKTVEPAIAERAYVCTAESGAAAGKFSFGVSPVGDGTGQVWLTSTTAVTPGQWTHVAFVSNATNMSIYINGNLDAVTSAPSQIHQSNRPIHIGAWNAKEVGNPPFDTFFNGTIDELKIYNRALTTEEIQADYEAVFVELNTLSGTVTSPCGTYIANATVTLTTRSGAEINTTQTDSTGHYAFANVSPDYYDITATKRSYWSNTNNVTVTTEAPETADIVLCQKGDLNTNSEPADAGDLAMMADATAAGTSDETYDLNGDGNPADEDDLTLLKDVSVGVAVLE